MCGCSSLTLEAAPAPMVSPSMAKCLSHTLCCVRGLGYSQRVRNGLCLQGHFDGASNLSPPRIFPACKPGNSETLFLRLTALVTLMCLFQFSKKILTLGLNQDPPPHPNTLRLQRMIRYSATLFVQVKPSWGGRNIALASLLFYHSGGRPSHWLVHFLFAQ